VGNVLEEGVLPVWRSPRAEQFRDKFLAHPQCRACEEFEICNGACPLYWRHLGFDELTRERRFDAVGKEHFER
jgi:radical SAM protein with 4Fe4S-binding SPASM domain